MDFIPEIKTDFKRAMQEHFDLEVPDEEIVLNLTRKEFEGNYTIVLFPFLKKIEAGLPDIGNRVGAFLEKNSTHISGYNVVKGFLNLDLSPEFWKGQLAKIDSVDRYGTFARNGRKVLVEFSSPNTNKPLHLGHIRNILLGWSVNKILDTAGYDVVRTQIINDRGIAVCKSMLAWKLFANGATPESHGIKSDYFVGKYYVLFEAKFIEEYGLWQKSKEGGAIYQSEKNEGENEETFFARYKNTYFNVKSKLGGQAKDVLIKWEANDTAARQLWNKMNTWCYEGFNKTYEALGVKFDVLYHESDTYILGKDAIEKGLASNLFYKKSDGSVWVDLEDVGLDQKILLRSDGTSVYITQDIGTAQKRYADHGCEKMIYVVGDEQEYHFKVLFEILKKLEESFAPGLFHLAYGMVDLPTGKMKSREGTVVDADDLIADVIELAKASALERGDMAGLSAAGKKEIFHRIGLGALKYFILKVDPKKRMLFNPEESLDMQGQTGPYIQNAYVRIRSIMRKRDSEASEISLADYEPEKVEIDMIQKMVAYPDEVLQAAEAYDPSKIANYAYDLAKMFHRFYHEHRILNAQTKEAVRFRLDLCHSTAKVLKHAMDLLGIEMPERM